MNSKLPLLDALIEYKNEENLILSMPGNKSGYAFNRDKIGEYFKENLGSLDITEVDPLDNLHNPEGVIKESQEKLREYYGSKKAFFMVNGSTNGNLASIFSAFNEGDKVIVERNCHKSVYNALILRKLKVSYIEPKVLDINGVFIPPDERTIIDAVEKNSHIKGIVLTYPNYFGITYDIYDIILHLKSKGIKVIIDGAHGAHFNTTELLPKSLTTLADYIVLSAHKTLPALTGGAYLLVNNEEDDIEFYVSCFMTTSPSYLIMASLDYARYYLDEYGTNDYNNLIDRANYWRDKINSLNKVKIISRNELLPNYDLDETRYIMSLENGYSGHLLLHYLRNKKIQSELSFNLGVVLIFSTANTNEDFEKLYRAIEELSLDSIKCKSISGEYQVFTPKIELEPYEVLNKSFEEIDLDNAIGRISKDFIIPYPPGIPIVCPGEVITKEIINIIEQYISYGIGVIGITSDKKCKVTI